MIPLRIDLGDLGRSVPKGDLSTFEAVFFSDFRAASMAKLMRMPKWDARTFTSSADSASKAPVRVAHLRLSLRLALSAFQLRRLHL